jgi:hypothetical protein
MSHRAPDFAGPALHVCTLQVEDPALYTKELWLLLHTWTNINTRRSKGAAYIEEGKAGTRAAILQAPVCVGVTSTIGRMLLDSGSHSRA